MHVHFCNLKVIVLTEVLELVKKSGIHEDFVRPALRKIWARNPTIVDVLNEIETNKVETLARDMAAAYVAELSKQLSLSQ